MTDAPSIGSRAEQDVQLEAGWKQALGGEFAQPYMHELKAFLRDEKQAGETIYPPGPDIFRAFNETPSTRSRW
ncbi:Uracil-DNA glycosylase [Alcanivorax sp. ALC70]|nr:Uracil-DNA glycosylase [Alcanivorax sp. ALC70]